MPTETCHDCRDAIAEGSEIWLSPELGTPDEGHGEPYCGACAAPAGIAA